MSTETPTQQANREVLSGLGYTSPAQRGWWNRVQDAIPANGGGTLQPSQVMANLAAAFDKEQRRYEPRTTEREHPSLMLAMAVLQRSVEIDHAQNAGQPVPAFPAGKTSTVAYVNAAYDNKDGWKALDAAPATTASPAPASVGVTTADAAKPVTVASPKPSGRGGFSLISSAQAQETSPAPEATPAPIASPAPAAAPAPSSARSAGFDPNNADQVRTLQEKLNIRFGDTRPALELTGVLDDATKAAMKQFKSDDFTDGKISVGYVKDSLSAEDFKRLNLTDPSKFNRNNPPEDVVKAMNQHLGLPEGTGYNSPEFQNAVIANKREKWIDASVNAGALTVLDQKVAEIKARAAAAAPSLAAPTPAAPTPTPLPPSEPAQATPPPGAPLTGAPAPIAPTPAEAPPGSPAPAPIAPTPAEAPPGSPAPTPAEPARVTPAPEPVAPASAPSAPAAGKHQLTKPHASVKVAAWQHAMNEYDKKHGGQHQITEDGLWGKKETQALFESLGGKGKDGVRNVINKLRRDGIAIDASQFEAAPAAPAETPPAPTPTGATPSRPARDRRDS